MLARYLRTSQQPVRYAMHPDLAQALSNYLGINLRAAEYPRATQHDANIAGMHQQHPLIAHTFNALMQHSDPADLMAYLDLMEQHGGPLHHTLRAMAHDMHSQERLPQIQQRFGQSAIESPTLRQDIARNAPEGLLLAAQGLAGGLRDNHPMLRSLQAVLRSLYDGEWPHRTPRLDDHPGAVPALLRAHDIGHAAAMNMQDLGHTIPQVRDREDIAGAHLRQHASDTLRRVVWPHLVTGGYS